MEAEGKTSHVFCHGYQFSYCHTSAWHSFASLNISNEMVLQSLLVTSLLDNLFTVWENCVFTEILHILNNLLLSNL